ncbi:MAG: hypothetical protein ATN33_00205 [Epulopiscium sp. Nele67-Bin001]|nr:MAG: hypothetical protein ATN33_00205 [Epulopiscium sp. Nele67-Bin001]
MTISSQHMDKLEEEDVLYTGTQLDIKFSIVKGDKIGLIGDNQTRTQALKDIVAEKGNELTIQYLPTLSAFEENDLEQAFNMNNAIIPNIFSDETLREYMLTAELLTLSPDDKELQENLNRLSDDTTALAQEAMELLTKFRVTNLRRKINELSFVEKKKVALVKVLVHPCDLLLLDEPTNFLDIDDIVVLEENLVKKECAIVLSTHDRYFLDNIVTKIVQLKGTVVCQGNYSKYVETSNNPLFQQECEWMNKGVPASIIKARIVSNVSKRKVIDLIGVSKAFGGVCALKDFSYTFKQKERIGLIGSTGTGKSTLLNVMSKAFSPDSGAIKIGDVIKIGYFTQSSPGLDVDTRVGGFFKVKDMVLKNKGAELGRKLLASFASSIPAGMEDVCINELPTDEKRQLYLLSLLIGDVNILLLDEPTNNLDMQTVQVLAEYVANFEGLVVVASNDRYFLDRVVDKILVFEGEGVITPFVGNYTDYKERVLESSTK